MLWVFHSVLYSEAGGGLHELYVHHYGGKEKFPSVLKGWSPVIFSWLSCEVTSFPPRPFPPSKYFMGSERIICTITAAPSGVKTGLIMRCRRVTVKPTSG